jgi:hypothetical protein
LRGFDGSLVLKIDKGVSSMAFDGTWNVTMKTPMGPQQGTMELSTDGDALLGSVKTPMGGADIDEGKVDGDAATWVLNMTSPMPMKLELTARVDGDRISGKAVLGPMGEATFEGTRV